MTFQEWVKQEGGNEKCATKHGFSSSTLGAWFRLERFPNPDHQIGIIEASNGAVDISELRSQYIAKKREHPAPSRQRRLQGSLIVRDLDRLKLIFDELELPPHRCNLHGPRLLERWATTNVTVKEVRKAVIELESTGRDAANVELIHQAIRESRIEILRGLE